MIRIPLNNVDRELILVMLRETSLAEFFAGAALAVAEHVARIPAEDAPVWSRRRKLLIDAAECAQIGDL